MKRVLYLTFLCFSLVQILRAQVSTWDGTSSDVSWYTEGLNEFHISTAAQLKGLSDLTDIQTFEGCTIYLDNDIDLNNHQWLPIGRYSGGEFKGTFDGGGHSIANLYIDDQKLNFLKPVGTSMEGFEGFLDIHLDFMGIFGYAPGSYIKNISVQGVLDVYGISYGQSKYIGGLVGLGEDIENVECFVKINIHDRKVVYNLGGVAGVATSLKQVKSEESIIQDSGSYTHNSDYIGGIAGTCTTAEQCQSNMTMLIRRQSGTSSSDVSVIGGIVGSVESISNSLFTGSLSVIYDVNSFATNFVARIGGITGKIQGQGNNIISVPSLFSPGPNGGFNWGKSVTSPSGEFTNAYYLNTQATSNEKCGQAVSDDFLKSGNPIDGFDTSIWVFNQGEYPQLKVFYRENYKMTYIVDGEIWQELELKSGELIRSFVGSPWKEGYTFSGWSEVPATMPSHDVIIKGSFIANKYKLTYKVDEEEYKSVEVEYGATITPEVEPTKEGYIFSGWSEIPETMPANDVTITGSFAKDPNLFEEEGAGFEKQEDETLAFTEQKNVESSIEIPETVTHDGVEYRVTAIAEGAFKDNANLIELSIPESIVSIGDEALAGCTNLEKINLYSNEPISIDQAAASSVFSGVDTENCILYVPAGTADAYRQAEGWKVFKNIVEMEDSDDINEIKANDGSYEIYTLGGIHIETLQKGVNIIRYSNGSTQKVFVK